MTRPPRRTARPTGAGNPTPTGKTWKMIVVVVAALVVGGLLARWSPVAIVLVAVAMVAFGIIVLAGKSLPLVGTRSKASGFTAIGLAALLATGGGIAGSGSANTEEAPFTAPVAFTEPRQPSKVPRTPTSPSPTATAKPRPTPTPTTFTTLTEDVSVPFTSTTVDDPQLDQGLTALVTAGVAGTTRVKYRVTLVNGTEVSRTILSEIVVTAPVNEVTSIGSRAPQPVPLAQPQATCDANYSGACVPIASDVDCAGGGGNGPAYVEGPVYIVGSDIYQLDRDGDGVACD